MKLSISDLYRLSVQLRLALQMSKLITSSTSYSDLYRLSEIIDHSERKFDCSNAQALARQINSDIDIDLNRFDKFYQLIKAFKTIETINLDSSNEE